jgi:hypothetical protein
LFVCNNKNLGAVSGRRNQNFSGKPIISGPRNRVETETGCQKFLWHFEVNYVVNKRGEGLVAFSPTVYWCNLCRSQRVESRVGGERGAKTHYNCRWLITLQQEIEKKQLINGSCLNISECSAWCELCPFQAYIPHSRAWSLGAHAPTYKMAPEDVARIIHS